MSIPVFISPSSSLATQVTQPSPDSPTPLPAALHQPLPEHPPLFLLSSHESEDSHFSFYKKLLRIILHRPFQGTADAVRRFPESACGHGWCQPRIHQQAGIWQSSLDGRNQGETDGRTGQTESRKSAGNGLGLCENPFPHTGR